ncbi:MAG TPA: hypothetical protein PKA66_06840 [Gemmatimonadales bacterium]|nr:hypothetical protein [Gemmatimonadales bacterium]
MLTGSTLVPNVLVLIGCVTVLLLIAWLVALLTDRNPLPFPDRDYHVFSASSRSALVALERLMQKFGHTPRFRIDSDQVDRTVFSNGTIINHPHPQMFASLGKPGGALGFVVGDPERAARESAQLLQAAGFQADVVLDAEPGLPITFVTTNALVSGALVFRKHVLQMGQKPPAWTPRFERSVAPPPAG